MEKNINEKEGFNETKEEHEKVNANKCLPSFLINNSEEDDYFRGSDDDDENEENNESNLNNNIINNNNLHMNKVFLFI